MSISKVQLEVWRIREELDRKLAKMSPQERIDYFRGVSGRIKVKLGRELKLRRAKPGRRSSMIADSPQE